MIATHATLELTAMTNATSVLHVSLFAGMAEHAGKRTITLPWSGGTTAEVRRAVAVMYPKLELLMSKSAVAVGARYAPADEHVPAGADVAIIPPVSGG